MKSTLLIFLLSFYSSSNDLSSIRGLYLTSYSSEENCKKFEEKITTIQENKSTLIKGYEGCLYFIKCKFISNPVDKFICFKKGKKLLEAAIEEEPKSVELRFLRYSIQKNLPRFLLYYESIEKDFTFVNENIKEITDKETKKFIINSIKSITK